MADSDNTTTLPFVIGRQRDEPDSLASQAIDSALSRWSEWQRARYASLLLCRVQQQLEARMIVNTGIQVLTAESPTRVQGRSARTLCRLGDYAVAREAEVFAMTEALKLQDSIPVIAATSLVGVIAKLEMIVGADRDIGDPTDFPWPHIASVLRDLKAIAGGMPVGRQSRERTRSDVARHWESAVKLVAALEEEDAAEYRGDVAVS
ncbi:hypothetical protein LB524_18570 [Mesorhizobium sp. ESP6-5]|uniref:hypothetical protein n=1 Tax=Mesorhizobium sp. ESP6-5 TaxID=2876623 RepID=UPI001CCDCCF8|nr:hypothetical protein [Mesorhizobium sp. ESP6-5]MBZ9757294.1 hypothetical protein [Mesorhizobium sp. ESP6-5]